MDASDMYPVDAVTQVIACSQCNTYPIAGYSMSGMPHLCEHCDTSVWAARMCSYCVVKPVAVSFACGTHLCDTCDLSLWVVGNEIVEHDV